jgi:tetratricopeptide (TPR) repeat protein
MAHTLVTIELLLLLVRDSLKERTVARQKHGSESKREHRLSRWGQGELESLLSNSKKVQAELESNLLKISRYYSQMNEPHRAAVYMEQLISVTGDGEKKAFCLISLGQLMEQGGDFDIAMEHYRRALLLEPSNECSWYFIHNNMGCCLNHQERFEEAEEFCREAIRIDPARYNAYINLGVSLEAREQFVEATKSFLDAMQSDAEDIELVMHVEDLVEEHSEIALHIEGIREALNVFRRSAENREMEEPEP